MRLFKNLNNVATSLWDSATKLQDANAAYKQFLEIFSGVYDVAFPKQKVKNKNKTLNSFWITKGLQRSSKRKQKLYEKFLKKNKQNQ